MKKLLILLFIVLLSCEKTEIDNELVDTEWMYTNQHEYTHVDKSKGYDHYDPETGTWTTIYDEVTKTMNDTVKCIFVSNSIVEIYSNTVSTDGRWGADPSTTERIYKWSNNSGTGEIIPLNGEADTRGILRIEDNSLYVAWAILNYEHEIKLTKR